MKSIIACLVLAAIAFAETGSSPVISSERTRNLRGLDYAPMLFEYHRQTVDDGRHFFTYPRRDTTFQKDFYKNHKKSMAFFESDSNYSHKFAIAVSPVIGIDYKSSSALGDTIWPAIDAGLFIRGFADSLDFDLDARIYSEGHAAKKPKSYDHEVFDVQSKDRGDGGIDYVSFARYRAHFALNYAWARLQLARDVLHWGPGYYNNLSLNQYALPYNMLSLDLTFGPLRIYSVYADLRVTSWSYSKDNLNDRNLYAHRYELALKNFTFGISELQILYNENKPWLFVPVAPLFIEKGNYSERVNNGALAVDMNVQLFGEVTQEGDFFRSDNSTPLPLYWDSVSGTYSYEKPYIKEVGGLQLISTMDGNWMLRRGTGRVSPRFLDNELLYNNHIVVVRDYLIVKGKRTKLVKDAKDHAYRIRGFMADSIVVESEEEYGFLQIMADGRIGTRYKRIPIEARMIPDMKSLGLSRTKKE